MCGGSSDGRIVFIQSSLSLTSNLLFSLINCSMQIRSYLVIRYLVTSFFCTSFFCTSFFCIRFDHERTRVKQFSDLSANIMDLSRFYINCDCQIHGKFKDSNIRQYKHFLGIKKYITAKT